MKSPIRQFNERAFRQLLDQVGVDAGLLAHEVYWALGEVRITRVTPTVDQFLIWKRKPDGLDDFWAHVRGRLNSDIQPEEVRDLWECVDLTLNARKRKPLGWQECLALAVSSEARCEQCGKEPPEVALEIDHILPVSRGGDNSHLNLRFLCRRCNRSRGNRFRWADVWRHVSW
jgi:hypothetical protein